MQMVGEQFIEAPSQRVWEALNDPGVLRASIPGCQSLEKASDGRFDATVEVKVGPIGARFKGAMTLADLNPPNSYTLLLQGNGGIAGSAKGSAKVRLSEQNGGTLINYEVDAQVGGRMAQLGGPMIDASARQFAGSFFRSFGEEVSGTKSAPKAAARPVAEPSTVATGQAPAPAPVPSSGFPFAWILAVLVAAATGFVFGRDPGAADSGWAGLAVGLLVILVAAAAFEYGRRSATPTLVLDAELLRRLTERNKQ